MDFRRAVATAAEATDWTDAVSDIPAPFLLLSSAGTQTSYKKFPGERGPPYAFVSETVQDTIDTTGWARDDRRHGAYRGGSRAATAASRSADRRQKEKAHMAKRARKVRRDT